MDYETKANLITGVIALILAVLIACAVYATVRHHYAVADRAAYLEGRFGIDHATAMVYAREEVR